VKVRTAIDAAALQLEAAGVASARYDAEELAAHLLGTERSRLPFAEADLDLPAYEFLVARRAAREPLQHLTGTAPFRRLELAVGPGVFIPRPETEVVVEAALEALAGATEPVVVDLCAGSGAIALSIASECPGAVVHAVERSRQAWEWLSRNVSRYDTQVRIHLADAADPSTLAELRGAVDVVVSNPPYIPESEWDNVEPEVRDHDPEIALFAGADGLDVVRAVAAAGRRLLRPRGVLVVEHSDRQGSSAPEVLRAAGFRDVSDHRDLADRDRYSVGTQP
jgi:release factor glutamine methyltransferase